MNSPPLGLEFGTTLKIGKTDLPAPHQFFTLTTTKPAGLTLVRINHRVWRRTSRILSETNMEPPPSTN